MLLKSIFLVTVIVMVDMVVVHATDCVNAPTYGGIVTLSDGANACAQLQPDETDADKGTHYVTCSNGYLFLQSCSGNLRYDIATGVCNFPQLSTCSISGEAPATQQPSGSSSSSNSSSSSQTTEAWTPAAVVNLPQNTCGPTTCALPDCFCYGAPYTAIPQEKTPQFIMLTFDDGITAELYDKYYRPLFIDDTYNLSNPNGCKIIGTMYAINDNTDYTKLQILASAGNEIASHTIDHILAQGDSPNDYANISAEIAGMRDVILQKTGDINLSNSLVGFRAPFLRVAGDVMFQVLRDKRFLYDSSIVNVETTPLWPFTLDYLVKSCVNPPCPTQSFPGLWVVPPNGWVGDDGYRCAMIDGCSVGENVFVATEQDWYNYYERNYQNIFYKNRVPMHMFTHGSMFLRSPGSFQALVRWLQDKQAAQKDVWLVSARQLIGWMKTPKTNSDMIASKWGCHGV